MNKIQERVIENLRKDILLNDGLGVRYIDEYEYKMFEIDDTASDFGTVFLFTKVGSKIDEGTWASIICRTTRHIAIGKRGGITVLNPRSYRNGKMRPIKTKPHGYWNAVHNLAGY